MTGLITRRKLLIALGGAMAAPALYAGFFPGKPNKSQVLSTAYSFPHDYLLPELGSEYLRKTGAEATLSGLHKALSDRLPRPQLDGNMDERNRIADQLVNFYVTGDT
ncbi:MAG: hypothetical protein AB7F82_06570, partial [Alphaproteobacteria bacterium]